MIMLPLTCKAEQKFPVMWNLQNSNEYFVGRKEFLQNMAAHLFKKNNCLIISGAPGFGQEQVIKQYAELHKDKYDIVWRICGNSNKLLLEQYINFARRWNKVIKKYYNNDSEQNLLQINLDSIDSKIIEEQVHYRLKVTKLNWLIIFDNVPDASEILKNLPKKYTSKGYGHLIISTNSTMAPDSNVMHLEKFNREESIELLLKITGENDVYNANLLAENLEDHPLAITGAAAFISFYKSMTIEDYNHLFLTERKKLWEAENKFFSQNNSDREKLKLNVFTTTSITIEAIKKESNIAYDLLGMIAFLDKKNIPENFLKQYVRDNYSNYNDNFNNLNIDFKNALSILLKYSILTRNYPNKNTEENKAKKEPLYSMHGLTQLIIQDILKPQEKLLYVDRSIKAINNILPNNLYLLAKSLSKAFYFKPHINMISKHAANLKLYNNDIMQLELRDLEYNLTAIRNDKAAEDLINKLEFISQEMDKANTEKTIFLKIRFAIMKSAFLAWVKTDYPSSLKEVLYAYNLLKTLPSHYHYRDEYLMIYNRLSRLYSIMGDNKNAFKYAYLGKEIIDNSDGFLDYQNDFLKILVKIYIDNGDYIQSLKYSNLSLDKEDIAAYLINADILIRMEKYKEAKEKLDLLNQITEKFLPNEHILYKTNIAIHHNYVSALLNSISINQAIGNIIKSQENLKNFLGSENYLKNCHVYISHKFLGELYEKSGDYIKAQEQYSLGLEILINTFNNNENAITDDLSDFYYRLFIINTKLSNLSNATEYINQHIHQFGINHPRSNKILDYIADNQLYFGSELLK